MKRWQRNILFVLFASFGGLSALSAVADLFTLDWKQLGRDVVDVFFNYLMYLYWTRDFKPKPLEP